MKGNPANIFRRAQAEKHQVDDIDQKGLEQEGERPAGEQGIDGLAGNVADIVAADIAAHETVDDQGQVGNAAKEQMAEPVEMEEDKRKQIEMEHRKQQDQGKALVEAALQADLEEINGPLQGKKFGWNILAFALNHVELLDLGNGADQIDRFVDPAAIGGNDLGIGTSPFCFLSPGHQFT